MPNHPVDYTLLRMTFEDSVKKRMMSEVPFAVLLSGGLDSSLVASIAQREKARLWWSAKAVAAKGANSGIENFYNSNASGGGLPQITTFSIGLPDSPDTKAALEVAKFLGTKHHSLTFTIQEGLNALYDVIYHLETFDVTTIRASTPMFLLSRKIKAMGIKMVLSGEGSDEMFGGYLYFKGAPNKQKFHEETVRRINNLHLSDCLRANKSTMAWGVEARVPFLDKQVSNIIYSRLWACN